MRVLLVDGHGILRASVQALLTASEQAEVVGAVGTGERALSLAGETNPDVVLLGMNLRDTSPVLLIQQLLEVKPETRVLVLAAPADRHLVSAALEAGASGYVLKRATASELMSALDAVCRNEVYLDPAVTRLLVARDGHTGAEPGEDDPLTRREREVLQLVVKGYTNRQIASELSISPRTVESHRSNLMAKLGLRSRAELVKFAQYHRLPDTGQSAEPHVLL